MRLTLEIYWRQHVERLERRQSVAIRSRPGSDAMVLTEVGDPYRGIIDARVWFDLDAFLDVYEVVAIDSAGRPRRTEYSYHFQVDNELVWREDYDQAWPEPLQHHRNLPGGEHRPAGRTSLAKAIEQCWTDLSEIRTGEDQAWV